MTTAAELQAFTSFDLGRLVDAMAAEGAAHPEAPATHALRAAAVRFLPWDQYNRTPWGDPTFTPRFEFLRTFAVSPAGAPLELRDALPQLHALVALLDATEPPNL